MDRSDRGASAWADHHQCSSVDHKDRTAWLLFAVCSLCNVGQQEPSACLGGLSYTAHRVHPWISEHHILFRFYRRQLVALYKPPIGGRIWISLALIIAGLIAGGFDYSPLYYWLDDIKLPDIAPVITDIHGSRMNLYYMAGAICLVAGFVSTPPLV